MRGKKICSFLLTIFTLLKFIRTYQTIDIEKCNQNSTKKFPKNFLIGASTSAYQIEGGWNETGKGVSIWDELVHTKPYMVKDGTNGDIACDSYHLYKQDVELLASNGHANMSKFDNYRFSISWPRILPNGEITNISQIGIDYYHNLIDELLKNGIQPMVTIYHWDLPRRLQEIGGWANPLILDYVVDYANLLFEQYGRKVKWWITLNEPYRVTLGYEKTDFAPALNSSLANRYIISHNLIRAHGKIFQLYHEKYRATQGGKIGIALDTFFFTGKTNSSEDAEAATRALQFMFGLYANPIFTDEGDYPKIMRKIVDKRSKEEGRKRSRLPTFTEEEKKYLKGSSDFLGLNHYTTALSTSGFPPNSTISEQDMNVSLSYDPSWPGSAVAWLKVVPWGMRELLKYIKNTYKNPQVFITENGFADDGKNKKDNERISYHHDYLSEVWNAMNNHGCNVIGYNVWSLFDNFEWLSGYKPKFGLVHVDFDDSGRKRTPKPSYYFFKKFLTTRILPDVN